MAIQALQDYWFMISPSDKKKRQHKKNAFWHLYFEKNGKKVKTSTISTVKLCSSAFKRDSQFAALINQLKELHFPFQQLPPVRPQFKGPQGKKTQERNSHNWRAGGTKRARINDCLLYKETKCCDARYSKISTRQTWNISAITTQASQGSYFNSSRHQLL